MGGFSSSVVPQTGMRNCGENNLGHAAWHASPLAGETAALPGSSFFIGDGAQTGMRSCVEKAPDQSLH